MNLTDQQKERIKAAIKDWIASTYFEEHISIAFKDWGVEIEFENMFTDEKLNARIAEITNTPIYSVKDCKNADEWWLYFSNEKFDDGEDFDDDED